MSAFQQIIMKEERELFLKGLQELSLKPTTCLLMCDSLMFNSEYTHTHTHTPKAGDEDGNDRLMNYLIAVQNILLYSICTESISTKELEVMLPC